VKYDTLSPEIEERIRSDRENGTIPRMGFLDANACRRIPANDKPTVWRTPFVRDTDKILHSAYYNRFTDKTQVFSFYKNDDISRRALHVQLVSRIARTIGSVLGLNLDLIEAIALGHDMGHTPFGHAGETYLDELYFEGTGRHFAHNVHSVRVLDGIFPYNITLQTLNGILSHDGEIECDEYRPLPMEDFQSLDAAVEACYQDRNNNRKLMPSTLEGCLVRICDIISYLGKDRQDAKKAGMIPKEDVFAYGAIGRINAEIINNLSVNIIENSYGKPYIKIDREYFDALSAAKKSNYTQIYLNPAVAGPQMDIIRPMFGRLYHRLVQDVRECRRQSPVFRHHINFIMSDHYVRPFPYEKTDAHTIVTDYIASMTDDYFVELHAYLFPKEKAIQYHGYFC